MELCKLPEVACETTMGPIEDFDFDAAILFSDLLFPLESMGMGLTYGDGGPRLGWHLRSLADLNRLRGGAAQVQTLEFQADALRKIRTVLPGSKGLLGFVGGPLTLFCYAVEGSHKGSLDSARAGLTDGRFEGFFKHLFDLLVGNILLQAKAGCDVVAVMDTCAGEFDPQVYRTSVVPALKRVLEKVRELMPEISILYYSKGTGPEHWKALEGLPIDGLGIDWNHDLAEVLEQWGTRYAIQGNIDPHWLFLEPEVFRARVSAVFEKVKALPAHYRQGWICGLGHGVLPKTPESNVRLFVELQREFFPEEPEAAPVQEGGASA
jgi:uroporphyrinogen decarboxylase